MLSLKFSFEKTFHEIQLVLFLFLQNNICSVIDFFVKHSFHPFRIIVKQNLNYKLRLTIILLCCRIIAKIDDEMLKYYCNEDMFLLEVRHSDETEDLLDILLVELMDH